MNGEGRAAKRSRTSSAAEAGPSGYNGDLESRVQRIEAYLNLGGDMDAFRPQHSPLHAHTHHTPLQLEHDDDPGEPNQLPDLDGRTSHLRMKTEHLEHPRYSLGPVGQASYHGETSLFDDFTGNAGTTRDTPNHPPLSIHPHRSFSPFAMLQKGQEEEEMAQEDRMRLARRARHRYATPEEGEAYMDAHFCWASQTYGVVSRPLLLRECHQGRADSR